jgi:regulator of PEP synthase PpsR (kinase-PPPase family)
MSWRKTTSFEAAMGQIKRTVFFISDGTGITAEMMGKSLLTQFEKVDFHRVLTPFVKDAARAHHAVDEINLAAERDGEPPIVFSTLVNSDLENIIQGSKGMVLNFFSSFLKPLEDTLGMASSHSVGKSHSGSSSDQYLSRIDAVNYALENDDGHSVKNYDEAEIILVGVSRSGKTPSSLYLALQFGIKAANYPITEEDMEERVLPKILQPYKHKLFGLTIDAERLSAIRNARRANSRYSSITRCEDEVRNVEAMLKKASIPFIDTTDASVEEIATQILLKTGLTRHN